MNLAAFAVIVARERETAVRRRHRLGRRARRRRGRCWPWPLTLAMLGLAGIPATAGLHRQVLPDRGGRRRRLHVARRRDRDRLDDLARLLPAGRRGDVDAAPRAGRRRAGPRRDRPPGARRRRRDRRRAARAAGGLFVVAALRRGDALLRDHPVAAVRPGGPRRVRARRTSSERAFADRRAWLSAARWPACSVFPSSPCSPCSPSSRRLQALRSGASEGAPERARAAAPSLPRAAGRKIVTGMDGTFPSRAPARACAPRRGRRGDPVRAERRARGSGGRSPPCRRAARAGGNPPLLIAVDQEGGAVKRLRSLPPARAPRR